MVSPHLKKCYSLLLYLAKQKQKELNTLTGTQFPLPADACDSQAAIFLGAFHQAHSLLVGLDTRCGSCVFVQEEVLKVLAERLNI